MKKNTKPMRLQQKILITNMLFFALPCLVTFLCIVTLIREEGNRRINQNRMAILQQIDSSMELYLNNISLCIQYVWEDYGMNQLFSRHDFRDKDTQITATMNIINFLSEKSKIGLKESCDLMVLGANGYNYSTRVNVNSSTIVYPDLTALTKEPWFESVLANSRIHYVPTGQSEEYSSLLKDSALHAVCGIKDFSGGEFTGIIDVNITHESIREIFSAAVIQKNQGVALMDQKGNIITATDETADIRRLFTEECLQMILSKDQGYYSAGSGGVVSQIHFVTNESTDWKIVMYEESTLGEWLYLKDSIWIILVIGLCVFLIFIMSIYDSRYISKPVQKLKADMYNVYKGDFSVRMEVENMDEFGELSLQFNMMVERIEQLIEQLKEKDHEARILELQALQAQIHPHFLYNTLASIRFLLEMGMEEKAGESLMALGKLLRRTFSDYRELIPVREEIETLEQYLILMNNRYQNTFEWVIRVEEEIQEYLIPRISIQPLVENSISHGFNDFNDTGRKGHIRIEGKREADRIIISVEDDGQGADLEKINRILESDSGSKAGEQVSGIGIKNVQERIRMLFGEEYGLKVCRAKSGGVRVSLYMPARREENQKSGEFQEERV
ncbi:MAG: sensor histidine kinase [Lachnospiraceae bacterium]|nr:sensor histidine kinase [Lachnospiraceae bacterium]